MSNYKPLFYTLILLFVFAGIVQLVIAPFVDVNTPNEDSIITNLGLYNFWLQSLSPESSFITFFDFSFDLPFLKYFYNIFVSLANLLSYIPLVPDFNLQPLGENEPLNFKIPLPNLFGLLPTGAKTYILQQLTLVTYIPDFILIPFSILSLLSILWSITKLILA